jgi:hypothetical protein
MPCHTVLFYNDDTKVFGLPLENKIKIVLSFLFYLVEFAGIV